MPATDLCGQGTDLCGRATDHCGRATDLCGRVLTCVDRRFGVTPGVLRYLTGGRVGRIGATLRGVTYTENSKGRISFSEN